MGRVHKAYEAHFRALLLRLRARKLERGVDQLTGTAERLGATQNVSVSRSLTEVHERLRNQVKRWELRTGHRPAGAPPGERRFLCDAGLGGLARWLRAAGYEALWFPDIDDAELLRKAPPLDATVLTTDSLMMQRGVLRDGIIPALWLPPTLTIHEQLAIVFREFDLSRREPRCMRCGGELRRVDKESVRERIPPKTWKWIDDYFVCARCGHLFWRGTHWQRINDKLPHAKDAKDAKGFLD